MTNRSTARWEGDLKSGNGQMTVGDDRWTGPYTFASRFEGSGDATNPEELLGAAHAGCFSMAFAGAVGRAGYSPESVETSATVHLDKDDAGAFIAKVELVMRASVPGIEDEEFQQIAATSKEGCPVSRLFDTEITLDATLA